jgi:hypothetical protein
MNISIINLLEQAVSQNNFINNEKQTSLYPPMKESSLDEQFTSKISESLFEIDHKLNTSTIMNLQNKIADHNINIQVISKVAGMITKDIDTLVTKIQ